MQDYRQSAVNAIYLIMVQGMNYLVPLFLMFHLIKYLGVSGFGEYAFWYSVLLYVQAIVEYGFSFSGTREVATANNDSGRLSNIFFQVTVAKLLMAFVVLFVALFCLILNIVPITAIFAVLAGIALALIPNWYFQGLQKLRGITILGVALRVVFIISVYILIDGSSTVKQVLFLQLLSLLPLLFVGNYLACRQLCRPREMRAKDIFQQLRAGWPLFSTSMLSMVISNGGILWLGATATPQVVGVYAAVERVVKAVLGMFTPISQALYPLNSKKFATSFESGLRSVLLSGAVMLTLAVLAVSFVALTQGIWFDVFTIPEEAKSLVPLLLLWAFLSIFNNVAGIQTLSASGAAVRYAISFKVSALVFVAVLFFGSASSPVNAVVLALVLAESSLVVLLLGNIFHLVRRRRFVG
ncbi:oligosaccharide flippase family protein [Pseudomonas sp. GD03860]|uniref:oligosaccharide flippase family protein n=1 Tax=Pseudomonas TaxID=286 RepID=UPI002363B067|nr:MULTISPECIES: oligosaccharide flippase family protein [Pseudomonas]MDD2055957.1 oligosaccharide flippase family protein [Pseudomonas putida]MDH0640572.1 oligosaccharide flippase family protein [Pseudomonas sp. GD03860]